MSVQGFGTKYLSKNIFMGLKHVASDAERCLQQLINFNFIIRELAIFAVFSCVVRTSSKMDCLGMSQLQKQILKYTLCSGDASSFVFQIGSIRVNFGLFAVSISPLRRYFTELKRYVSKLRDFASAYPCHAFHVFTLHPTGSGF